MRNRSAVSNPGRESFIGTDEISIRKGHTYRIVVSDLERRRPIWFGGDDRSEASMDQFYRFLGEKKAVRIRLAVMDMWKAFRTSTHQRAASGHPVRQIPRDEALGRGARQDPQGRIRPAQRQATSVHQGAEILPCWRTCRTSTCACKNLKLLLAANQRLNTAYLPTVSATWDYNREAWALKVFFENWRASLKWQRLKPYEKFAQMIERHWDGIAAYCQPQNKVALGFVEGLNNKIRVMQRRAYGLRDEEYLRLKVLTSMLPQI
ncbi:MAG: transposase [Steroidobacteraceae bacterium]